MLIDIDKIIVKDRIRKDFGDIAELAEDIKRNGLINPPVIMQNEDGTCVLLAGERRLRAMRELGWQQIEVRPWATVDDAGQLEIEGSENEERKDFTPRERFILYERLTAFHKNNGASESHTTPTKQARKEAHITSGTITKVREILEHQSELEPQDITDWDDGKLSTAKLYRTLKERLNESRKAQADDKTRYESQIAALRKDVQQIQKAYDDKVFELRDIREKQRGELEVARKRDFTDELKTDAIFFAERCARFIKETGGYAYITGRLAELPERERNAYINTVSEVAAWAQNILNSMEVYEYEG